jgi:hypothetical protein
VDSRVVACTLILQFPAFDVHLSKSYVFDVARARASPTSRLGHSHTARLPLEGLSAFGGDRED